MVSPICSAIRAATFVLVGLLAAAGAAATTVVVNDSTDALHGLGCASLGTGTCTLRDGITFANAHAGPDEIHFAIVGPGVHTITLDADLPAVAGDLTIDGYTQSGSSPNTNGPGLGDNAVLSIEINGNGKGCLSLGGEANTVRGLVINRCGGAGILVTASEEAVSPSVIAGNFIGVDAAGAGPLPNEIGVFSVNDFPPGIVIGGTVAAARNIISGNRAAGVRVLFDEFSGVAKIQGNFIGTDATGSLAIPNGGNGVELSTEAHLEGNVISGNLGAGVTASALGGFVNHSLFDLAIQGNVIGADVSGTLPLGNRSKGIFVVDDENRGGYHVSIDGNVVAFNGIGDQIGGGVVYFRGHFAENSPAILGNSIFDNTSDGSLPDRGLGIYLGNADTGHHHNSPCNTSSEEHELQNSPVLESAMTSGSSIRIRGTLDSYPSRTYYIELFANPACDPSGYGEGKTFLGSTRVTTDDSCVAAFDVTLPVTVAAGQFVTATATAAFSHYADATSEFSSCTQVINPPSSFYTVTPCRLIDTREAPGLYGGPSLEANSSRTFVLADRCGTSPAAKAVSVNVTVTGATAAGDLRLVPAGISPLPSVSTINYRTGQTRANNAVVTLGSGGDIVVRCDQPSGTVDVIVDVNGYFQ